MGNFPIPMLYQYKPNCFINLAKLETIELSNYDPNIFWYYINGHVVSVPKEAHEKLMKILVDYLNEEERSWAQIMELK